MDRSDESFQVHDHLHPSTSVGFAQAHEEDDIVAQTLDDITPSGGNVGEVGLVGINSVIQFEGDPELLLSSSNEFIHAESGDISMGMHTHALRTQDIPCMNESRIRCHICLKTYANKHTFKRHLHVHSGDKPYQCTLCGQRYSYLGALKAHTTSHSRTKPGYPCPFCNKKCWNRRLFLLHLKPITASENFTCPLCYTLFKWRCEWENHACFGQEGCPPIDGQEVIAKVEAAVYPVQPSEEPDNWTGSLCLKPQSAQIHPQHLVDAGCGIEQIVVKDGGLELFANSIDAVQHMDNTDVDLVLAEGCEQNDESVSGVDVTDRDDIAKLIHITGYVNGFVSRENKHKRQKKKKRTHVGRKCSKDELGKYCFGNDRTKKNDRLRCNVCSKYYASLHGLRRHSQLHAVEKTYQCTQCPQSFTTYSHWWQHKQKHSATQQCPHCKKLFNTRQLKNHIKVKRKWKRTCSLCRKVFSRKCEWSVHACLGYDNLPSDTDNGIKSTQDRTHGMKAVGIEGSELLASTVGDSEQAGHPQYHPAYPVEINMVKDDGTELVNDSTEAVLPTANIDGIIKPVVNEEECDSVSGTDLGITPVTEHGRDADVIHHTGYTEESTVGERPQWAVETHSRALRTKDRPWRNMQRLETGKAGGAVRCHICSKTLSSKHSLRIHLKQLHSEDKPYQCSVCPRSYPYLVILKSHLASHSKRKVGYLCPFCERQLWKKRSFMLHLQILENCVCPVCHTRFQWRCELMGHPCARQGNYPFNCDENTRVTAEGSVCAAETSDDVIGKGINLNDAGGGMTQVDAIADGMDIRNSQTDPSH